MGTMINEEVWITLYDNYVLAGLARYGCTVLLRYGTQIPGTRDWELDGPVSGIRRTARHGQAKGNGLR
jgi:hypothetical protein